MSTFFLVLLGVVVLIALILLFFEPKFVTSSSLLGRLWNSTYEGGTTRLLMIITLWVTNGGTIAVKKTPKKPLVIKGIGVTWNKFVGPAINMIPGILLIFIIHQSVNFCFRYLTLNGSDKDLANHPALWLALAAYFAYLSHKKLSKTEQVDPYTVRRYEVLGQGIVSNEQTISKRGKNVTVPAYNVITESKPVLPFWAKLSAMALNLKEQLFETNTMDTATSDNVQFRFSFRKSWRIVLPGIYFGINEEDGKEKNSIQKAELENAVIDLIQRLTSVTLLSLSGKQIKKILVADYPERQLMRDSMRDIADFYNPTKKREGVLKVVQDLYVIKKITIDFKYPESDPTVSDKRLKALKDLEQEMREFILQILPAVGKVKASDDRLGVFAVNITQKEMNYASEAARKAAEQKVLAELQNLADSTRMTWLTEEVDKIKQKFKDKSLTAKDALYIIQVEFGKRTGYNFDGDKAGNVNVMFSANNPNPGGKK
jgi:hypothetical protein